MQELSKQFDSFYRGRAVCITGGAGFIGSHLCDALVQRGAQVTVIDDLCNGRMENLQQSIDRVRFIHASILDRDALADVLRGCEIVFHHAALASVPRSVERPLEYFQVNAAGTMQVIEAARDARVRRIIYAASSSAYGEQPDRVKVESMQPDPLSPYAAAKYAGELMLRAACQCYDVSGVSLRYFNIFGERQRPDSPYAAVIPRWIDAYLHQRKPIVFGDGSQTRDFTHVSNAVHANLLAGVCDRPLRGQVVNIACGCSYSLLDLLKAIAELLDVNPEYEIAGPRAGEVMHSCASIDAAHALLGYQPLVQFHEGLQRTVRFAVTQAGSA